MTKSVPLLPFRTSFTGTQGAVREGIAQVLEWLSPLQLGEDELNTVQLVLAEALNNIIEHALRGTKGQSSIEITGSFNTDGLMLDVIDEGVAMPRGMLPRPQAPDVSVDVVDLPEGGFGWLMIHTLAKDVRYVREEGSNHLMLKLMVGS